MGSTYSRFITASKARAARRWRNESPATSGGVKMWVVPTVAPGPPTGSRPRPGLGQPDVVDRGLEPAQAAHAGGVPADQVAEGQERPGSLKTIQRVTRSPSGRPRRRPARRTTRRCPGSTTRPAGGAPRAGPSGRGSPTARRRARDRCRPRGSRSRGPSGSPAPRRRGGPGATRSRTAGRRSRAPHDPQVLGVAVEEVGGDVAVGLVEDPPPPWVNVSQIDGPLPSASHPPSTW